MSQSLNARDLERVSAYLDNALPAKERAVLEQRLKAEPALAAALADLQRTRALLRRAPQRRVPRQFKVRPEMVSAPQKNSFGNWTAWNLVSAAATLMLVLVVASDLWVNSAPIFDAAAPAAEELPQALMAQEAPEDSTLAATPTASFEGGAGEIEMYEGAEETTRQAKDIGVAFDFRSFIIEYATPLEIGLGLVALVSAVFAWWRSRRL